MSDRRAAAARRTAAARPGRSAAAAPATRPRGRGRASASPARPVALLVAVAAAGRRRRAGRDAASSWVDFGDLTVTFGVRLDRPAALWSRSRSPWSRWPCRSTRSPTCTTTTAYAPYAAQVSLFTAAMLLVVVAGDLILLLVGWEVMGICSYLLIGHDRRLPEAPAAAVKAFLVTRVGDVGFLLGIAVLGVARRQLPDRRRARATTTTHGHADRRAAAAARRRGRQERAVPAAHLAARRDGRPDADLRADPRRHHGRRRRVRGHPAVPALRAVARPRWPCSA